VVEERGPDAGRGERLGEDVAHPAARAQALHGLGAGDEVGAVPDDPGEVDELGGEQRLEAVPLAELVGLRGEAVASPYRYDLGLTTKNGRLRTIFSILSFSL